MRMFIIAILMGLISTASLTKAAPANELVITWKADGYIPSSYSGKALPIHGTTVFFAIELVANNKLADLSNKEIRWYVDDNLLRSGTGLTNFAYTVPPFNGDSIAIRVVLIDGKLGNINQFINLPIGKPEAVIDAAQLPQLKPLFYFFNISSPEQLTISWEELDSIINLRAIKFDNPLEFARTSIKKP